MEFIDKELLKNIGKKYSDESMASAVIDIVMSDDNSVKEECNPAEDLVRFIQLLEGVRIRLKEIHWSTKYNFEHEQTDLMGAILMSKEDEIAEVFMGMCGFRFVPGQIVPIFPKENGYREILNLLAIATLDMIKKLLTNVAYVGVIKELEDLYAQINKMTYLSTQE